MIPLNCYKTVFVLSSTDNAKHDDPNSCLFSILRNVKVWMSFKRCHLVSNIKMVHLMTNFKFLVNSICNLWVQVQFLQRPVVIWVKETTLKPWFPPPCSWCGWHAVRYFKPSALTSCSNSQFIKMKWKTDSIVTLYRIKYSLHSPIFLIFGPVVLYHLKLRERKNLRRSLPVERNLWPHVVHSMLPAL